MVGYLWEMDGKAPVDESVMIAVPGIVQHLTGEIALQ
jgi:hypothetical protein